MFYIVNSSAKKYSKMSLSHFLVIKCWHKILLNVIHAWQLIFSLSQFFMKEYSLYYSFNVAFDILLIPVISYYTLKRNE